MRAKAVISVALLLAAVCLPATAVRATEAETESAESNNRQVLEEIVARVNNEIITLTELRLSEQTLRQELRQRLSGQQLEKEFEEQKENVLRDLIDQSLLVQRGRDRGVSVEADVIKRLDELRQSMNLGSMEELERAMAAQGVSIEDYKERIREQIITNIVIQHEVAGNVFVDTEKVRNYYLTHREEFQQPARVRLREILVSTQDVEPQELAAREERVREILQKIRRGEAFDELAREYSDAPTAQNGGDMGYFDPEKLAPTIRDTVDKLLVNGVADPMRTQEGWLILQLTDRRAAGIPPFEEVESQIRNKLYMDEVQPALRDFLGELRREAYVTVKAGYTDTGAVEEEARPRRRTGSRRSTRRRRPVD